MFTVQALAKGTLAAELAAGATSGTLNSGHTFSDATKIMLIVEPDVAARTEFIEATISSDAITSLVRAKDGTTDVTHPPNSKVWCVYTKSNHDDLQANGVLGYAERTTDFTSTVSTSYVDVTDVTTTVTVPAGARRVKITAFTQAAQSAGAAGVVLSMSIREGTSVLGTGQWKIDTQNYYQPLTVMAVVPAATATAGSHTYKVSLVQSSSASVTLNGTTWILVEYLGGI